MDVFTPHRVHTAPCSHRTVFTPHRVHTTPCSHRTVFTPHRVHTAPCSHRTVFTPHRFHTAPCSHRTVFTPHCVHTAPCSHRTVFTLHHVSPMASRLWRAPAYCPPLSHLHLALVPRTPPVHTPTAPLHATCACSYTERAGSPIARLSPPTHTCTNGESRCFAAIEMIDATPPTATTACIEDGAAEVSSRHESP